MPGSPQRRRPPCHPARRAPGEANARLVANEEQFLLLSALPIGRFATWLGPSSIYRVSARGQGTEDRGPSGKQGGRERQSMMSEGHEQRGGRRGRPEGRRGGRPLRRAARCALECAGRPLPCDSGPGVSVPAADSGRGGKAKQAQATRAWQRAGLASKHVVSVSGAWHKNVRAAPGGDTSASSPWLPPVLLPGVSDRLPGPQT